LKIVSFLLLLVTSAVWADATTEWHAVFSEYPLTAIKAQGWLRTWLETQQNGLTGHVEDLKGRCFEEVRWGTERLFAEENRLFWFTVPGHWHDAWIRFAYLFGDPQIIEKVQARYDWTLAHPDVDGFLGPRNVNNKSIRPQALFFRGLMAYHAETHDQQMLHRLVAHYVAAKNRAKEGKAVLVERQGPVDIEILAWLWRQTGDKRMLDLALELAQPSFAHGGKKGLLGFVKHLNETPTAKLDFSRKVPDQHEHGVIFMEKLMEMALLYMCTGDRNFLTAAEKAFQVVDLKYMLADGCVNSREWLNGKQSWEAHETCTINNSSWTCGYLLQATGNAQWADRIEKACLNAGLAVVTKDFKQVQYFSSPNQVIAQEIERFDNFSGKYPVFDSGRFAWCCTASVNRIIPNYIARMWLRGPNGGVVAALYGPSALKTKTGTDETPITIIERTSFPFSNEVEFEIQAEKPVRFPFWMRVPGWCEGAELQINGEKLDREYKPATFVKLDREFRPGDRIRLHLPMRVKATQWPGNGIALERGPLVYSLRIEPEKHPIKVEPLGKEFPKLEMTPKSPWNYALDVDAKNLADQVKIIAAPMTDHPWNDDGPAPVQLQVPARRVMNWELTDTPHPRRPEKLKPGQLITPGLPEPTTMKLGPAEMITLVPIGATCLRLTVFPKVQHP